MSDNWQPATGDALSAAGVEIEHHFIAGDLYSKRVKIRAGCRLKQHVHPFDHVSALVSGAVNLEVDGLARKVTGPAMLLIAAGKEHSLTAITDTVWHCIHITDDTDSETVDATILNG